MIANTDVFNGITKRGTVFIRAGKKRSRKSGVKASGIRVGSTPQRVSLLRPELYWPRDRNPNRDKLGVVDTSVEKIFRRALSNTLRPMILSLIFFFSPIHSSRCIPFIARIIEDNVSGGVLEASEQHVALHAFSIDDTILSKNFQISNFRFTLLFFRKTP